MFKKVIFSTIRKNVQITCTRNKQIKVPKTDRKLEAQAESLAARGFLRHNKPWNPPAQIDKQILQICSRNELHANSEFETLEKKYVVLKACFEETGYDVPNSLLHTIESVEDLINFYETPVDTRTPFETLTQMDLPKNLNVQKDYVRFHPETDTLFGGKSAFPRSSNIVTGLKAKKKYKGFDYKKYIDK